MRIKLTLQNRLRSKLNLNYHYEISSAVYKILQRADPTFSEWLHEVGYTLEGRRFKLFTISNLQFGPGFRILQRDGQVELGDRQQLTLSFFVDQAVEMFVAGVFVEQRFGIGTAGLPPVDFYIRFVEVVSPPKFESVMRFRALSPINVSCYEEGKPQKTYMSPEDPGYGQQLFANLLSKYESAHQHGLVSPLSDPGELRFQLLNKPRRKGILIKAGTPEQTKVIGYEFDFEAAANPALLRIGYECGFGWENPMFGCVEVVK